jgi:hypothetical protein
MTDKLKHKIINYLNKEYSGLIRYETDRWEDLIFYMKDDKFIFEYNKKNGYAFISYGIIWSFLETYFGLEYEEIQDITKEWVEEQFKSEVTTTGYASLSYNHSVEEQFKSEVTTTSNSFFNRLVWVEEQFKLEVTTTNPSDKPPAVEEQFKSEVTATWDIKVTRSTKVEEQFKLDTNDRQI